MATTEWSQTSGMTSEDADDNLVTYAEQAEASATAAANSASNAASSASDAATSETNAQSSATTAAAQATAAASSASSAATSATNASTSVTAAQTAEANAEAAEASASTSATNAATSASNAATSATEASGSATTAASEASSAATSATNAATSQTNAATSATNAAASEAAAATSETNAASSASAASTSASNAATSATAAETAETNAGISSASSAASAVDANASAVAAATSETNAAASESAALASEIDAESARDQAQAARDTAEDHKLAAEAAATSATNTAASLTGFDLDAIAASKADTAVDVFVYDTSKDSDGGAWRKRTQGTSWYNETLNTATRGSRREFPAVAVIVAESDKVTIYDGDDPALPMWMVFNLGGGNILASLSTTASSVKMFNNVLAVGDDTYGISTVNLISDRSKRYRTSNAFSWAGDYLGDISQRNDASGFAINLDSSAFLVDDSVNDVAMTVLPNAPIDAATGLPVPTIAVATDGGVSVIKDDGTVADLTASAAFTYINFTSDNRIVSYETNTKSVFVFDVLEGDASVNTSGVYTGVNGEFYDEGELPPIMATNSYAGGNQFAPTPRANRDIAYARFETSAFGGASGFGILSQFPSDQTKGMVAYTTSTYNTGWMNGDIKGAFLSDTDDTDLVYTPLNSTTDYTTDWTQTEDGWTINPTSLVCDGVDNLEYAFLPGLSSLSVGDEVAIKLTVSSYTSGSLFVSFASGAASTVAMESNGSFTFTGTLTSNTTIYLRSENFVGTVTDIEISKTDADRSVNNNGLIVNGTITRSPVATGADLVAYSGFSASNYLEQLYNSDLDFGTGDFCVMGWVKDLGESGNTILHRSLAGLDGGILLMGTTGNVLRVYLSASSSYVSALIGTISFSGWNFFVVKRESGVLSIYVDGVEDVSVANSTNISYTDAITVLGTRNVGGPALNGSLSLLRISATAPTAEQIAKIYEDEKFLFQENAQASLAGTSDAVTALAHDPDTGLLHVGTSDGRSVFQGLRRVSNTTDAVSTAISASNDLIVEQ